MPSDVMKGAARRTTAEPLWTPAFVAAATAELARRDPALRRAIEAIGPCPLMPERGHFSLLVRIIVSQQISVKAARSVARRLRESLPGRRFTPAALAGMTVDEIRAAGLTRARAEAVKGFAEAVQEGRIRTAGLGRASDAEILASLTALKGIGRWSVEMLLLFGYGRPDVFPDGDLGVRKAIGELYGQEGLPTPGFCRGVAEAWRPYRSVASWYLWRFADKTGATLGLAKYPV